MPNTNEEPTLTASTHVQELLPNRAARRGRRLAAVAVAGLLGVGAVACADEDGDGSTTNEEVDEVQEDVDKAVSTVEDESRKAGDEVEQQVDEGTEEPSES